MLMKIMMNTTGIIIFSVCSLRIRFSYCPLQSIKNPLGILPIASFSFCCASLTVLPKSLSLTLNKTVPRNNAFSELIIGGPSVIFMSATADQFRECIFAWYCFIQCERKRFREHG